MSRAWQIRVARSLTHHVHVEDGLQTRLELLGILSPERTAELLAAELSARGFTVEDGKARKEVASGVVVEVDTCDGTVTVRATAEGQVELAVERTAPLPEQVLRERVDAELATLAARHDEAAREALTRRLEPVLVALAPELDAIADAVTRAALKEKAAQLGEIVEVSENAAGEMTIRVRV